ncbi:NmrA family NAD(P)-binding protein [Actinorugispora endophytica]|uniref:Uncharacterized protein YbjT (DUF2867 family) n=1 Tax=Actinorugispora endophytica TaxID=1605990 RepID=A0A4V3D936_9ACTN|nr:NAD(P)H-binding protein [Actinorugispora endophytica]TDQ54329.1 uncharacterized protein YbjT (DUF2867 family) [Actinorugispora endophytica]
MTRQTILVLGATGSTGRRVAGLLRSAGHDVRAASRGGGVRFDWTDPETWEPALAGATKLYLMAPDGLAVDPSLVACAVEQGVRHMTLLSSRSIEAMGDERLTAAERTVRDSGADWTIVRPDWFDQNFDEGFFRPAVLAGELALPLGDVKQGFVDAGDIAAVAAAALTGDGHAGRVYELTGPEALSFPDALAAIGRASGRTIRHLGGDDDYTASLAAAGVPVEEARRALDSFAALRRLGDAEPTDAVRRVTGRAPKSFAAYAAEAARNGAWQA